MRFILFLILFSLVACVPSSPDSPRGRMNERMGKQRRTNKQGRQARQGKGEEDPQSEETTQPPQTPGVNRLTFPVQMEGDNNIGMSIESKENNTKVTIYTTPEDESLNILAGFDGQVSLENPRRIILTDDHWELIFDLEEDISLLAEEPNTSVTAGDVLASTTGSITFSLKKNGDPVRFCLNLINQSEGLVDVQILNSEGQCEI